MIQDKLIAASMAALGLAASGAWGNATFLAHYNGAAGNNASLNADYPTGTAANDLYLSSNKGVIATSGLLGTNCISFPTQGTVAEYDSTTLLNANAGTAMMWYQMTTAPSSGKAALFSVGTSNSLTWGSFVTNIYLIAAYNSSTPTHSSMALVIESSAGASQQYSIFSPSTLDLTQWHNYAFTWNVNTATNTISAVLYVDGAASGTAVTDQAWAGFDFTNNNTSNPYFNNKLMIGSTAPSVGPSALGKIDEVAITNDAKSASDIAALYSLQTGGSARELTVADLQSVPEVSSLLTLSIGGLYLLRKKH